MSLPDMFDLSGRIALVTGSSRGLGRVLARGLAEAGVVPGEDHVSRDRRPALAGPVEQGRAEAVGDARTAMVGDLVHVLSYGTMTEEEAEGYQPIVVNLDEENRIRSTHPMSA